MNQKRNVRKSSQRRSKILAGLVLCLLVAGIAAYLRFTRGKESPSGDLSALPDAPDSWRTVPEVLPEPKSLLPAVDPAEGDSPPVDVSSEFVDEFTALARTDPKAAAELLARFNEGEDRDAKLAVLMDEWTASDPTAAAEWVAGIPAGSFLEDATGQLMIRWGEANPEAAVEWVNANIRSGRNPSGAATFASAWTRSDPGAAMEWAAAIEDTAAKKEACGAIAYQLGLDDPARAGTWIAGVKDPVLQDTLTTGLISTWAGKDPSAAAAWLDGGGLANTSDATRRKAALMLVSQWTIDDPRPASMWINALAEGPLKENSKVALAQTLATEAPQDALIWADAILDETERHDVILSIYEDWVEGDPTDFKKQLVQRWSGISDPEVRKGIYGLLYDYDPAFKDEVQQLIEKAIAE
jgi:hypothetical protein